MRNEHALLLLCARVNPDAPARAGIARLAREKIDWQYLVGAAQRHGVVPLLCRNLNAICPGAVPPDILSTLSATCLNIAQKNLLLARELIEILNLLSTNDISAIPYKGPVLALAAYGNLALRPITDLDILIRPRDLRRAQAILRGAGFRDDTLFDPQEEAVHLEANCEWMLTNSRVILDVHWQVMPKFFYFPLDLDGVWQRLTPLMLAGTRVNALAIEDAVLILCVHGAKHIWKRLEWVVSVAELARVQTRLDWDALLARARASGVERMVALGFLLAQQLLDAELPAPIASAVRADRALEALASQIRARLFDENNVDDAVFEGTFVDALHAQMYARPLNRLRYYWYAVCTPTVSDVRAFRLPRLLTGLYRVLRPLRVLARFGPKIINRQFRGV